MSRVSVARACLLGALLLSSCTDDSDEPAVRAEDGGHADASSHDAGASDASDAPDIDAASDAGRAGWKACLDTPNALPSAPTGALPCQLVPPGLSLP